MPRLGVDRKIDPAAATVDLHIHSTHSDGVLSPAQIVEQAVELKMTTISLTDHDTVSGVDELIAAAGDRLDTVPAVEMSSIHDDMDIHILGYYIDHREGELLEYLEEFRIFRAERVKKILANLSVDGVKLDYERVKCLAQNGSLGRPHIAEALKEKGYVNSINEAFVRFLGYHSPYYEPKMEITPKEIVQKIKRVKGVPVVAHPGAMISTGLIYQLIMDGCAGIEVWHPEHSRRQEQELSELAIKNGLLMTGGSDYHGYRSGSQIGRWGCRENEVEMLRKYRKLSG
jgi:3',5'-nucleoside bisphosphate phosphatase